MDHLVLIRVAPALEQQLAGSLLTDVGQEGPSRFRFVFERAAGRASLLVSLRPAAPWIGRPAARWSPATTPEPFALELRRTIRGARLLTLRKDPVDRVVCMEFSEGHRLVVELSGPACNLVLLDATGTVKATARRRRAAADRLALGRAYRPAEIPGFLWVPFGEPAEAIDQQLDQASREQGSVEQALRRTVFAVGRETAALVMEESRLSGRSPGRVLAGRLAELAAGRLDPVIRGDERVREAARLGENSGRRMLLWPWPPAGSEPTGFRLGDAAATAGFHHDLTERYAAIDARVAGLRSLVERRISKVFEAESKATADLAGFENPDRFRHWAEALLAGLRVARRRGDAIVVPDPYDPAGGDLVVPADPRLRPQQAAQLLFARHRRALRGLDLARRRVARLREVRESLQALRREAEREPDLPGLFALEETFREAGLPVAADPRGSTRGRTMVPAGRPRLEGVRMLTSLDGMAVLIGRSGRGNHRLTFKLAMAEDFWFHVLGRPGAHVVVRNPQRLRRPPPRTLQEAASAAAWFSDAREDPAVDVQWTRRRYVRHPRGASPGTVLVKRYETLRVVPGVREEALEQMA